MLPELETLLATVQQDDRKGWIANPLPIDSENAYCERPTSKELAKLKKRLSNVAIAEKYGVTETAVRKWLANTKTLKTDLGSASSDLQRLTKERVGRVIGLIGQEANVVVQEQDDTICKRLKYASAHDIRRGCAQRLINQGVSAETLKLILRHSDFATTEKFYGAVKSVQSASLEIRSLASAISNEETPDLNPTELAKLRKLLSQL